jgi:hypothetical protein
VASLHDVKARSSNIAFEHVLQAWTRSGTDDGDAIWPRHPATKRMPSAIDLKTFPRARDMHLRWYTRTNASRRPLGAIRGLSPSVQEASSLLHMPDSAPVSDDAAIQIATPISDEATKRLADAVAHLAADGPYFVDALCDYLLTLQPVARQRRLTVQQERYLIESGSVTAEKLAAVKRKVGEGFLQLRSAETFLSHLCATLSLEDVSSFWGGTSKSYRQPFPRGVCTV